MDKPTLRHYHIHINSCFVHLAEYGRGESIIKSSFNEQDSSTRNDSVPCGSSLTHKQRTPIVVYIPGNPSVLSTSHDFLTSLYLSLENLLDSSYVPHVLAIGQNDYDHPENFEDSVEEMINFEDTDLSPVERAISENFRNDLFHLEMQILNKLIILKNILKYKLEDCRLYFVGHSIGCYIVLRFLQGETIVKSHYGSVLIHPAMENIARTNWGQFYQWFFKYRFDVPIRLVSYILDRFLPKSLKLSVVRLVCSREFVEGASLVVQESITKLVASKSMNALIMMGLSELNDIKDISIESMIKPHAKRLRLIYATGDDWINADYKDKLRHRCSELYMEEHPYMHAFLMDPKAVSDYAIRTAEFIKAFIEN